MAVCRKVAALPISILSELCSKNKSPRIQNVSVSSSFPQRCVPPTAERTTPLYVHAWVFGQVPQETAVLCLFTNAVWLLSRTAERRHSAGDENSALVSNWTRFQVSLISFSLLSFAPSQQHTKTKKDVPPLSFMISDGRRPAPRKFLSPLFFPHLVSSQFRPLLNFLYLFPLSTSFLSFQLLFRTRMCFCCTSYFVVFFPCETHCCLAYPPWFSFCVRLYRCEHHPRPDFRAARLFRRNHSQPRWEKDRTAGSFFSSAGGQILPSRNTKEKSFGGVRQPRLFLQRSSALVRRLQQLWRMSAFLLLLIVHVATHLFQVGNLVSFSRSIGGGRSLMVLSDASEM